ncbi:MAG: porphobilinogen synthase [Gammaproteobacteria bacterium]|nr:porphobilinogen synthase [Gammaproteobacteria bacterium]
MSQFPKTRLRRLRQNEVLRGLIRETQLDLEKLILPLFIKHGLKEKKPLEAMPGHFQFPLHQLEDEIKNIVALGIRSVILFGIPEKKDKIGSDAYAETGIIQSAIPLIKKVAPDLLVLSDLCFCEYMDHGHCGVVNSANKKSHVDVDNDKTLALLAKAAISHAKAGADVIAPSGNMDGMVGYIRQALDEAGFTHLPILSYSVKYASAMYEPFREAAQGAPQFGNRQTYQMDYANLQEALRECRLDVEEGADMLMVKPAHTYLDVILRVKQTHPDMPLCAYHTSGEYAMIKAAHQKGWLNEQKAALEVLTAIHRAGADFIITYFAKDVAKWFQSA